MSCAAFYKRRSERPANLTPPEFQRRVARVKLQAQAAVAAQARTPSILGTWDYKWPLGTKIRVAFQRPPLSMGVSNDQFAAARDAVCRSARRWNTALAQSGLQIAQLPKLDFLEPKHDFEPPLGAENSITDQHRSPFGLKAERVAYDVLVSLQDLPVTRADPYRPFGEEVEHILFPISELGSYARRSDYAAPTAYLGRFGRYLRDDFVDFFDSEVAQHTIVHEFGHVLGLAHVYQHPTLVPGERSAFYRPTQEIIAFVQKQLEIELTPELVDEYVLRAWPGSLDFSDWLEFSGPEKTAHQGGKLDTVMAPPYYSALIVNSPQSKLDELPAGFLTQPSLKDLQFLRLMYEPGSAKDLPLSRG